MAQSSDLREFYDGYYPDTANVKREVTARQTVDHLQHLAGASLGKLLDVGSGEGAVLQELEDRGLVAELSAVEISNSGIDRTIERKLKLLKSVLPFDGYKLPFEDKAFDIAIAVHVLEHVEHERLFLAELRRVSRRVYVEVPLEHTFRLRRSIAAGKSYGHINHYNFDRFINVLETSGLKPVAKSIFANSREYETLLSGKFSGSVKHLLRSTALRLAPTISPNLFVYVGAAACET